MANVRPQPTSYYYSGQGRLFMGERDPVTGRPISLVAVGNVPALEIAISVQKYEHKESQSGLRSTDVTVITEQTPTINITLESFSPRNLALGVWGTTYQDAAGTVTSEEIMVSKGAIVALRNPGVTNVVITLDGESTPLDEATNYDIDPGFGTIYFKADAADITGTTPVKATVAYEHADTERLEAMMLSTPPERFLRFEGLNTINGELVVLEIPRVAFEPFQSIPLINEEIAQAEVTGNILLDSLISSTSQSKFFSQRYVSDIQ